MRPLLTFIFTLFALLPFGAASAQETQKKVTIMGQEVLGHKDRLQKSLADKLPEELDNDVFLRLMTNRVEVPFLSHSPTQGSEKSIVTVVEMVDLNCNDCIKTLRMLDEARKKFAGKVRLVHVHLPFDLFTTTNPAAFYGKLAQKAGVFWQYREKIIQLESPSENVYLNILLDLGVSRQQMRNIIRSEARKFYQELDADTALGQKMGETHSPVIFINGIRLSEEELFDQIEALIQYEIDVVELKRRG